MLSVFFIGIFLFSYVFYLLHKAIHMFDT